MFIAPLQLITVLGLPHWMATAHAMLAKFKVFLFKGYSQSTGEETIWNLTVLCCLPPPDTAVMVCPAFPCTKHLQKGVV